MKSSHLFKVIHRMKTTKPQDRDNIDDPTITYKSSIRFIKYHFLECNYQNSVYFFPKQNFA